MNVIDCRNLPCPAPVVKTGQAMQIQGDEPFSVLLDHGSSLENVKRFATSRGYEVTVDEQDYHVALTIRPAKNRKSPSGDLSCTPPAVILISSDRLGNGPDELGRLLMKNFVITLLELPAPPGSIFFINSGVMLVSEGSELLEPLAKLESSGTGIYSCGVCLDYFCIRDRLAVGGVTNMFTIVENLHNSTNLIIL